MDIRIQEKSKSRSASAATRKFMRDAHRVLGYFMAGMMAVYAISGVLLVYRDTDFLKREKHYEKIVAKNLNEKEVGKELKIRNLEIEKLENGVFYFKNGTYNTTTGQAKYTKKELPFVLDKMTKLHKSPSKEKLGRLNTLFGLSLFFFVISSFFMFNPKSKSFKNGMIWAGIGLILALVLIFI